MKFRSLFIVFVAVLVGANADIARINHDTVQPLAQPDPVTMSEKAAVKFKPQLEISEGCASYPVVNAVGEISGGLKGSGGTSACEGPPLGSQVYGRAMWHNDVWAIMYAWYFPKGFFMGVASRRHDWSSAVVWIDNPDFATPKILGLSTSTGDDEYQKKSPAPDFAILGGTTPTLYRSINVAAGQPMLDYSSQTGDFQPLVMWEQLPEEARVSLNTFDFGDAFAPMNDAHFEKMLKKAWPF